MRIARAAVLVAVVLSACKGATDAPKPTSLVVTPSPVTLTSLGQTQQLTATVNDQNGSAMTGFTPTFTSNASAVASVTTSGLVTSAAVGTATVTVAAAGLTSSVPVTVSQTPAQVVKLSGDGQLGPQAAQLGTALRVRINDANGIRIALASVTFTATGGGTVGGSASTTVTADVQGEAQVTWTLGTAGTAQSVSVTSGSAPAATFTATSVAVMLQKIIGDNQTALVGYATNIRPAVRVTNAGGPAAGVVVTFAISGGGGSLSGAATATSNASGIAQVSGWVVGAAAGANALSASATSANSVSFAATGQSAQYTVDVRNVGPAFSPAVQAAFDSAKAHWERIIYGDQSDIAISTTDACGLGVAINETVDDIIILARFDSIDGPGQVLGSAGACSIRTSNGLAIYGTMRFDTADVAGLVANGSINAVILHEMGHVLGFSTLAWNTPAGITAQRLCAQLLTSGSPPNVVSQNTYLNCSVGGGTNNAGTVFDSIGGTSYSGGNKVPLENCATGVPSSCGPGNYNSHWRESTFFNELMTGYLNAGTANPLSVLTIAAFEDVGYRVNRAAAQTYTRTFTASAASVGTVIDFGNDVRRGPIDVVDDRTGRVVRVIQP